MAMRKLIINKSPYMDRAWIFSGATAVAGLREARRGKRGRVTAWEAMDARGNSLGEYSLKREALDAALRGAGIDPATAVVHG